MSVEIYENVLSNDTLTLVQEFFLKNKEEFSWTTNHLFWPQYLNNSSIGTIQIIQFTEEIKNKIYDNLVFCGLLKKVPRQGSVLLYQWLQGSAISWHNDKREGADNWLGCTIYLNETWNPDWGGAFCYKENYSDNFGKFIEPKFNRAVSLQENLFHSVSSTSVYAPPRTTIQIFYQND